MGKKQDILTELYTRCKRCNDFVFTNEDVKVVSGKFEFKNPFDVTKIDNSAVLPDVLRNDDVFVVHLGKGRHRFVSGIWRGYHTFEAIPDDKRVQWPYRRSLLNSVNTSESNVLSMANNQRIIHDFLYEDIAASPKAYGSNRTHIPLEYHIGETPVSIDRVQVEIDFTLEYMGEVTFFEAKNGAPHDFNVFQLFHPYHYYMQVMEDKKLEIKIIRGCYLVRGGGGGGVVYHKFGCICMNLIIRKTRHPSALCAMPNTPWCHDEQVARGIPQPRRQ